MWWTGNAALMLIQETIVPLGMTYGATRGRVRGLDKNIKMLKFMTQEKILTDYAERVRVYPSVNTLM